MKRTHKRYLTALIRSARPRVQADHAFVERLGERLQARAELLPRGQVRTGQMRTKPWWLWSSLSLGAAMAVIAGIVFLPAWFISPRPLSGYIQKGPFISGSAITVQELDDQLQPTGKNYQVTTSSDFGDYTLTQKLGSPYVEVIAQGYYYNEVHGELSNGPLTLRAMADVSNNRAVNVNVLTTLTSPRIRYLVAVKGESFAAAKRLAEQEILTIFHITGPTPAAFETMNISHAGSSNGILLAASAILQGQQSVAQLSELLSKLSLEIETDGHIGDNNEYIKTLQSNATELNTYAMRKHLKERLKALGQKATVPEFEQFIEPLALSAAPFSYRITLLDNMFGVNHTSGSTIKVTITGAGFVPDQEKVSLKNLFAAKTVRYIDDHTLIAEFPIDKLSAGSYTVIVRNVETGRTGVTDGEPLETAVANLADERLILRGYAPKITKVTGTVSYLNGGTIAISGQHFAYGTFVWMNDWQVPTEAIRVANDHLIHVDLSPALIANNSALPRKQALTITVQTPDFQKADNTGFQIQ